MTFCWALTSTRSSVPGIAGSRSEPRSIRATPSSGASAESHGPVVASTSRTLYCGSGGTPRSRRLRSIRLRRRPNGMSVGPLLVDARVPAGGPVAPGAPRALRQLLDRHEAGAHDRLHHQLGDAIAPAQRQRGRGVEVDQVDLDLPAVAGVDGA